MMSMQEDTLADVDRLATSCSAYAQAVETLCGPLETDVRSAAQQCWQLRNRSMQVKGGLFRQKVVTVQEAVFSEEAEQHSLGAALAQWQSAAEGAVAAAAVDVKAAEQRALLAVMGFTSTSQEPGQLLPLLDTLLAAYGSVAASSQQEGLAEASALLKALALHVGSAYLAACPPGSGLPPLAAVLQKHAAAAEWSAALAQPDVGGVVPLLEGMAGSQEGAAPAAVMALLAQCPLLEQPADSIPTLVSALLRLAPTAAASSSASGSQGAGGAPALCSAVLGLLRQLAHGGAGVAGDGMLQLLLAAARGVAVEGLLGALDLPTEAAAQPSQLSTTDLTDLARAVFAPLPQHLPPSPGAPRSSPGSPPLPLQLAKQLDWQALAQQDAKLGPRALLVLVAVARHLAAAGMGELSSAESPSVRAEMTAVPAAGADTWEAGAMAALLGCVRRVLEGAAAVEAGLDEGEWYLLCMLEAPPDSPMVDAVWVSIQLGAACMLCTHWLNSTQSVDQAAELLSSMRLEDKLWQLSDSAGGEAAVGVIAPLVEASAGTPAFGALLGTLAGMLGAATSAQQAQQAVAAVQQIAAQAVRDCLDSSEASGGGSVRPQPPLIDLLGDLVVTDVPPSTTEDPDTGAAGDKAYATLCAWLVLVLPQLGRPGNVHNFEGLLLLLDRLTQAAYYLLSPGGEAAGMPATSAAATGTSTPTGAAGLPEEASTRLWLLASSLLQVAEQLGLDRCMSLQQRLFQLSSTTVSDTSGGVGAEARGPEGSAGTAGVRLSWLALLACWLLDALALKSALLEAQHAQQAQQQGQPGGETSGEAAPQPPAGVAGLEMESVLRLLREGYGVGGEAGVEEALQIQESASQVRDSPAAVPLWHEFFLRYMRSAGMLSALVSHEDLLISLSTLSQQYYHASGALATAISQLSTLAQAPTAPTTSAALLPFLGDPTAVRELGRVHAAWAHWAGTARIARTTAAAAAAAAPAAAAAGAPAGRVSLPPALPPVGAEERQQVEGLQQRWGQLGERLEDVEGLMRFWARRGEKASVGDVGGAAGDGGGTGGAGASREGSVPDVVAEAQSRLWEASQRWEEQLSGAATQLRRLVCQRYKPLDLAQLQARGEELQEGQQITAAEDPDHTQRFLELRLRARGIATHFVTEAELASAASGLQLLEHLLLRSRFADMAPDQAASVRSQLLTTVAEVLLDGSTPPVAAPFLTELFERAVGTGAVLLTADAKTRLVPRIARAMRAGGASAGPGQAPGQGATLREREAVVLLRASLDPEALLEAGRLLEFQDTLRSVLAMSKDVSPDTARSLLGSFDVTRFAVMAVEGAFGTGGAATEEGGEGGASSSATSGGKPSRPGLQSILELAVSCLAQEGAEPTGAALLEGLLSVAPAPCFACCLHVALVAPASEARDAALGMLCKVPPGMLPPEVVAEALALVTDAFESNHIRAPSIPFDLVRSLLSNTEILASIRGSSDGSPPASPSQGHPGSPDKYWTAKLGASTAEMPAGSGSGSVGGSPATASASGGGSATGTAEGSSGTAAGTAEVDAGPRLLLLPVPPAASAPPLHVLAARVVGAALQSLLRTLGSGVDGEALSDQLLQLLGVVFDPVGAGSPWLMAWCWTLYQDTLHPFLSLAGPASDGAATAAFRQCWSSLPWDKATFHAASPAALAALRGYLPCGDRAAVELLHGLDWGPVLAKVQPERSMASVGSTGAGASQPGGGPGAPVYSLGDEEEEEDSAMVGTAGTAAGQQTGDVQDAGHESWAAQLSLLALHSGVMLRREDLPDWLAALLYGVAASTLGSAGQEERVAEQQQNLSPLTAQQRPPSETGVGDVASLMSQGQLGSGAVALLRPWVDRAERGAPLLPLLLAAADWEAIEAAVASRPSGVPWLVLPLLLAPQIISGDVASRLVHMCNLLGEAALKAGSPQAAAATAGATEPLLLFSLCHGQQEAPDAQQGQQAQQAPLLELPPDIPPELLEGTVEGQQLKAQQQAQQGGHVVSGAPGSGAEHAQHSADPCQLAEQAQHVPLVLVEGSWRLAPQHMLALLDQVLLPLAARHASHDLLPHITPSAAGLEFQAPALSSGAATAAVAASMVAGHQGGVVGSWQAPTLQELAAGRQRSISSPTSSPGTTSGAEVPPHTEAPAPQPAQVAAPDTAADAAARSRLAVVTAVLRAALQQPATVLTDAPLPFSNSDLPWDSSAALYVSAGSEGGSGRPAGAAGRRGTAGLGGGEGQGVRQPLRALRARLSSLVHSGGEAGSGGGGGAAGAARPRDPFSHITDVAGVHSLLAVAIEDACYPPAAAPLAACLLRLVLAAPMIHTSPRALTLAENIVRHLATPHSPGPQGTHPGSGVGASTAQQGVRGLMRRSSTGSTPALSPATSNASAVAVVIPVVPASHAGTTTVTPGVVPGGAQQSPGGPGPALMGPAGSVAGAGVPAEPAVPASLLHAVAAAEGLPRDALLAAVDGAARGRAPLLAAFACQRLRGAVMLLDKAPWQQLVIKVLKAATAADCNPEQPLELAAVWLEVLSWVGDSRWRRLPPGLHQQALVDLLEVLELRVAVLRVLTPDQLGPEEESPQGGSPTGLLASLKAMAHNMPGQRDTDAQQQQQLQGYPSGGTSTAAGGFTGPARAAAGEGVDGEGPGLGQRLSKSLKNVLGRGAKEGEGPSASPEGEGARKKGPLASLRAKLGGGPSAGAAGPSQQGSAATVPPAGLWEQEVGSPVAGLVAPEVRAGLGAGQSWEKGPFEAEQAQQAAPGAAGGGAGGDGGEKGVVRQKLSTGLQKVGASLSAVRTKLSAQRSGALAESALPSGGPDAAPAAAAATTSGGGGALGGSAKRGGAGSGGPLTEAAMQHAAVAERERDACVRLGLTAFAVAAYVKTVLCPALPLTRNASAGGAADSPLTPALRSLAAAHQRRTSSMRFEEAMLRELDAVLDVRSELDLLDSLIQTPLVACGPGPYTPFLTTAPRLLAATTGVAAFQAQLQALLLGQGPLAAPSLLAVLRAGQ